MDEDNSNIPSPPAPTDSTLAPADSEELKSEHSTIRAEHYNLRSPSVKRILAEARELGSSNEEFSAQPLEENIFEWHFTFRGAPDTDFDVGIYHGRILLPADYPMNPPALMFLTPNGRFEVGKKICLSISSYHPETWRPCWSIRTAVAALVAFMNTSSPGAIGSLECTSEQRRAFARKSLAFECPECGPVAQMITYTRKMKSENTTDTTALSATNTQRLFRMPHSNGVLADPVTTPETIVAGQPAPPRVLAPMEGHLHLGDIRDPVEEFLNWQMIHGQRDVDADADAVDIELGNSASFGVTVGFIVVCIAGIIIRRFIWDVSWSDVFGLP